MGCSSSHLAKVKVSRREMARRGVSRMSVPLQKCAVERQRLPKLPSFFFDGIVVCPKEEMDKCSAFNREAG